MALGLWRIYSNLRFNIKRIRTDQNNNRSPSRNLNPNTWSNSSLPNEKTVLVRYVVDFGSNYNEKKRGKKLSRKD